MSTMQSSTPSSKPVNSSLSTSNSLATTLHGAQHVHHRLRLGCDDVSVGEGSQQSLTSVSALLHSGRVSAVVGCNTITTSSSLTALLHVLGGREALQASGHVLLNGTPASAPSYQARCAFLSDECIVAFDELSVRESLEYIAAMRSTSCTHYDSCDEIDDVINQLRLTREQHTKLTHCSLYVKRRVALGVELLLRDPLVVLLGDPLRGLATHEGQQYLDILHHVAAPHSTSSSVQCSNATTMRGVIDSNTTESHTRTTQLLVRERVVVLTMMQPRWALLQYVDDVMLLVHTRCVYSGSLDGLLAQVLRPTNLLATANNDNSNAGGHETTSDTPCVLCGNDEDNDCAGHVVGVQRTSDTIHQIRKTPARATVSLIAAEQQRMETLLRSLYDTATLTNGEEQLATRFSQTEHTRRAITRFLHECATGSCTLDEGNTSEHCYSGKCIMRQLYYMSYYDLLRVRSSVSGLLFVFYLLLLIGLACLLATIYHYDYDDTPLDMNGVDKGQSAMQSRVGLLFCVVAGTMLHAILSHKSIHDYYRNYQHRQRAQGYCGVGTFLLYTTLSCTLVRLVFITCLFGLTWLILFFLYRDIPAYTSLLSLALIVGLTSLASYFVVSFICALMDALHRPTLATYILLMTFTVNVLLAGLVLNLPTLPHVIRLMSFCTILRLSYESAILTQFINHSFGCHTNGSSDALQLSALSSSIDGSSSSMNSMCFTGLEYAHFMGFDEQRCRTNMGLLAAFIASCVVGCFFAMTFYRPRPHKYTVKE